VRSHAKASSAGSNPGQAGKQGRGGTLALALAVLVALVVAVPVARAAAPPEFLIQFGNGIGPGGHSAAGETSVPTGIATDPDTDHVYIADLGNARISEFTAWGTFVKAWGLGVDTGAPVSETCTTASGCQSGLSGSIAGQLEGGAGVAVDSDGNVYVRESTNLRVQKFSSAGTPLLAFGGDVTSSGPGNTGVDEQQVVTIKATAGTFTLTQTTALARGVLTTGSNIITGVTTSLGGFHVGDDISTSFAGIPPNTTITAVGANTLTMSTTATANSLPPLTARETTGPIPFGATETELQAALEALPGIGSGNVTVTGGPGDATGTSPYMITFSGGPLQGNDIPQMTANATGLTEGTKTATVATTVAGGGPEICRPNEGDLCKGGTSGGADGQFTSWSNTGNMISVGSDDTVYVADDNRIQLFEPSGAFKEKIALAGYGQPRALALDSDENIYIAPSSPANTVRKLNPIGTTILHSISVSQPNALATDSADNVYVTSGTSTLTTFSKVFVFDKNGVEIAKFGEGHFPNFSGGIATNSAGDVYISNTNFSNGFIRAYGPEPTSIEPPPDAAPTLGVEYASNVGSESATLSTSITPHFWSTDYYVQYGLADCASNPCSEAPAAPGETLESTRGTSAVSVPLTGLMPDTNYHYRFVVESDAPSGGPIFGLGGTFTTHREGPLAPPDGRVYEMVSPPAKNGGQVGDLTTGTLGLFTVSPIQASLDGEAITYHSFTSFGETEGGPSVNQFLSSRGQAGWITENINPRAEASYGRDPLVGFSADLSHAAVNVFQVQDTPPLAQPAPPENVFNLFARDNETGELVTVTTTAPETDDPSYCLTFEGASADFDRMIFSAQGKLTPDSAPINGNESGVNLYEWSPEDGVELASELPDGSAAEQEVNGTGFGRPGVDAFCDPGASRLHHAISADGSRMFWSYFGGYFNEASQFVFLPLFARVIDETGEAETIQLDAPQGVAGAGGGGKYWDASLDGSKVFFTASKLLTPNAKANDLYRYDFDQPPGEELQSITANPEAANVQGVLGTSEDGSHAYFAARGVLTTQPNSEGDVAQAGQDNVYAWQEGEGVRFVARNVGSSNWSANPSGQTARVSPDGRHLAFVSSASPTGYDNQVAGSSGCMRSNSGALFGDPKCTQVFLYDLEAEQLRCISCNPTGGRPAGPSLVPTWSTPFEQPRYLLDGGRAFFMTHDALDPHDVNGKLDVYTYQPLGSGACSEASLTYRASSAGCIDLISTGTGEDESYFLDSSADGRDVFFSTSQNELVPADRSSDYDIYDARIGGTPPKPPVPTCEGEACRGAASSPANVPAPSTSAFEGPANPKAKRGCPKGKRLVRRKGSARCVKPRKKASRKHKAKRAHAKRRAGK
jgi:hypothetical protein